MAHIVRTNEYNVVVDEVGDCYLLVFQRLVTTGNGTILASYPNEDLAKASAEKFPRKYEIALKCGYVLQGNEFVNTSKGLRVQVSKVIDPETSELDLLAML